MKQIIVLIILGFCAQVSLHSQTYYIQGTTDTSLGNKALVHTNELKIGNSSSATERAKNMLKIGDGSYIQIGEWEADDLLSFKASKYNFTNGNVGIGTTNPTSKLQVEGTAHISSIMTGLIALDPYNHDFTYDGKTFNHYALKWQMDDSWQTNDATLWLSGHAGMKFFTGGEPRFAIRSNGNVGIGTTSPNTKLHVEGSTFIPLGHSYWIGSAGDTGNRLRLHHNGSAYIDYSPILYIRSGTTTKAIFDSNGNIGIGTLNPQNKLDVNGIIRATEIKVETGWADFVFNEGYQLPTLNEVKQHIDKNKHLPGIPTEKEVKENGVNVGEMQSKLLQKIEELTLYLIQQEDKLQKQETVIEELKLKINEMERK
jgi:hypothetical protein